MSTDEKLKALKKLVIALYEISHRELSDYRFPSEKDFTDAEKEMILWADTAGHAKRISESLVKLLGFDEEV